MPVYEYQCVRAHRYEKMEGFDAPPEQECPQCGGPSRRLLSLPAVIFKGPGFYSTDYRRDGQGSQEGAAKGESPSGGDSGEPKSEASV